METKNKLQELTEEQVKLSHQVRDEWVDKFYNTTEIDKESFETGVRWIYTEKLNLAMPEVIYCDSWSEAVDRVAERLHGNPTREQKKAVFEQYSFYSSLGFSAYWVAFYDFFTRIGVLNDEEFNKYSKYIQSGVFTAYEYDVAIYAVQPPIKHFRDEQGRFHNIEDKAVVFRDGTGAYIVRGRALSEKYFTAVRNKTLTQKEFFEERNNDTRAAIVTLMSEVHGREYVALFFQEIMTEVHTYIDKKAPEYLEGTTGSMNVGVYTLFNGKIDEITISYVRCYCPSTDRMFYLGIDSTKGFTKADDAIASLYQIPRKLSKHIEYIQRQGERFSTIFTQEGEAMLETLSKEDLRDMVGLTGKEYFSLMRYEY